MSRFRTSIVWLTALFVLTGSAIGLAQSAKETKAPKAKATQSAKPGQGEAKKGSEAKGKPEETGARKLNHGFYVSHAAHCENVDDPDTSKSPDFKAPSNCGTSESAHGKYVSSVAQSDLGKKPKKNG